MSQDHWVLKTAKNAAQVHMSLQNQQWRQTDLFVLWNEGQASNKPLLELWPALFCTCAAENNQTASKQQVRYIFAADSER